MTNDPQTLSTHSLWQQGQCLEIEVSDLSDSGEGVGRWQDRVVFVPHTVPGDRVTVRLVRVKPRYAIAQLQRILTPSPHRWRPPCWVADKCGGCQWQHITESYQQKAKYNQIRQAFSRIGNFSAVDIAPMIVGDSSLHYRNKATYPLGLGDRGQVKAGYYQAKSHRLINLNQCPVQDERLNPLLQNIKLDLQKQSWPIYDETRHQGKLRHLALRIGRRTGETLLTLVSTDDDLPGLTTQAQVWLQTYPQLVGIALNLNPRRHNVIFGQETRCIAGKPYIQELFGGLTFQLRPETFFQVNTEAAEALLAQILRDLALQGNEVILDAYCGIGTFSLPLARHAQQVIGLEVQAASVQQAQVNAEINGITNVQFYEGAVETQILQ
ncbi:MAG: 23S rRNA (uracil(1939)-C(5))-methyltransferase RlmD, partial [Jaaginema sp. PMC 1079.18]|nr:23S rRNA (uracil(1939)-C(5))-methyltransferase RlmD [Jaaginema sp. PMC 1079.18]